MPISESPDRGSILAIMAHPDDGQPGHQRRGAARQQQPEDERGLVEKPRVDYSEACG